MGEAELGMASASRSPIGPIAWSLKPLGSVEEARRHWLETEAFSFFTSWSWIGTWLENLSTQFRPLLIRASIAGRASALAIGVSHQSRRRMLIGSQALHLNATGVPDFDCITIEHNGFSAPEHLQPPLLLSFLDTFARQETGADEFYLSGTTFPMPVSKAGPTPSLAASVRKTYAVNLSQFCKTDGDLAPLLSRNAREQLRRAVRYYEHSGPLRVDEADSVTTALEFFSELKRLHIQSWTRRNKPHSFLKPFFEHFHHSLIRECFSKGEIQLLRINAGNWTIGYLYNFRYRGRVYAYQSGFDDRDKHWRPGYVSHYLAINHNFRQGIHFYDLLAGENRLKQSFATNIGEMYWHRLYRPLFRFQIENSLRAVRNRWWRGKAFRRGGRP